MIEIFMTAQAASVLAKIPERTVVDDPAVAQHDRAIDKAAEGPDVMQHHQCARARG
jgi:hypothetical protein